MDLLEAACVFLVCVSMCMLKLRGRLFFNEALPETACHWQTKHWLLGLGPGRPVDNGPRVFTRTYFLDIVPN